MNAHNGGDPYGMDAVEDSSTHRAERPRWDVGAATQTGVENVFTPLLSHARELSNTAMLLVEHESPGGMTFATMPQATVFKLHVASTATYRSGIVCLQSPETSVAAFSLLRVLLEAWSHIAFIYDPREGGDARCRALRFERGSMDEWANNVRVVPRAFDRVAWQRSHDEKGQEIRRLWEALSCGSARPRTRRHVAQTLNLNPPTRC